MKWMLVVMIFGTQPVKTEMLFDSLGQCSGAATAMRNQQAELYNLAIDWGKKQEPKEIGGLKNYEADRRRALGLENVPTCIPHG
jgi:hypothetical protein